MYVVSLELLRAAHTQAGTAQSTAAVARCWARVAVLCFAATPGSRGVLHACDRDGPAHFSSARQRAWGPSDYTTVTLLNAVLTAFLLARERLSVSTRGTSTGRDGVCSVRGH